MRHGMEQTGTPIGRALARRAVAQRYTIDPPGIERSALDLTTPEQLDLPPGVREAVRKALANGETHYTARTGIAPLRRTIAERSTSDGFPATADNTVITNGGAEALYIALQTMVSAGDRVLLVEPVVPRLVDVVQFIGAMPVFPPALVEAEFEDARALVVSDPSGITGRALKADSLIELLEMAGRHGVETIVNRSDAPDRYEPAGPFDRPDLTAEAVTVGSFSGSYGLAGWRVGYFTAPAARMDRLAGLKEAMSISTTTLSQFAALAALEKADDLLATANAIHIRRCDTVTGILRAAGIPFIFPEVYPGLLVDIRQSGLSDVDFSQRLAAATGVIVEPASRYGESFSGHIRIDLRAREEVLREGVTGLAAFIREETS